MASVYKFIVVDSASSEVSAAAVTELTSGTYRTIAVFEWPIKDDDE